MLLNLTLAILADEFKGVKQCDKATKQAILDYTKRNTVSKSEKLMQTIEGSRTSSWNDNNSS